MKTFLLVIFLVYLDIIYVMCTINQTLNHFIIINSESDNKNNHVGLSNSGKIKKSVLTYLDIPSLKRIKRQNGAINDGKRCPINHKRKLGVCWDCKKYKEICEG